jgi:hypothetical protein
MLIPQNNVIQKPLSLRRGPLGRNGWGPWAGSPGPWILGLPSWAFGPGLSLGNNWGRFRARGWGPLDTGWVGPPNIWGPPLRRASKLVISAQRLSSGPGPCGWAGAFSWLGLGSEMAGLGWAPRSLWAGLGPPWAVLLCRRFRDRPSGARHLR